MLHIAFKGTHYRGWQKQNDVNSVQATLEKTIEKMFGQSIHCMGCGRTDAGVHASQFFCHIDLPEAPNFDFIFRINKMLPDDIVVYELIPVDLKFHAQHSALSRTYEYFVHFEYNPFFAELSYYHPEKQLDQTAMSDAVELLVKYKEYKAFCKTPDIYKSTECEIYTGSLRFNGNEKMMRFQINSNRFLRNMVRLIVGNLLEIGEGNLSVNQFEESLRNGTPLPYFNAAYPQGLYLSKVEYPGLTFSNKARWATGFNFSE